MSKLEFDTQQILLVPAKYRVLFFVAAVAASVKRDYLCAVLSIVD